MSWFPYTSTYQKLGLNPASSSGWGNLASVSDDDIYYNSADNSYYFYFKVEALSPNHITLKGKIPSFAGVYLDTGSVRAFVRVESATALANSGLASFRSGLFIYYSVDFATTATIPVQNVWKVTFWNLHNTGGTNGWKERLLDIYVCRVTDSTGVVFTDGSAIQADDLNKVAKQTLFVADETDQLVLFTETANISTKYDKVGGEITGNADIAGTLAVGGLLTAESGINANNTRITNVAVPTENNHVATKQYVDNVVGSGTTVTILDDSITSAKLSKIVGDEAVSTATIKSLAVTTEKLNDGAVTTAKLAIGAVSGNQIFTGISLLNKIAPSSLGNSSTGLGGTPLFETTNNSSGFDLQRPVTSNTIRVGAITETKIATDAITTTKILNGNVTADKLATDSVTNAKILNYTIDASKLNAGTNFTYNNSGQFTINKLTIGRHPTPSTNPIVMDATASGDSTLTIPYPSALKIAQSWSTLASNVVNNGGLRYVLTLEPQYGGPTGDILGNAPPTLRYRLFPEEAYPSRICIHEQLINQYAQSSPNIVRDAWTKRVFNKILFNNTDFFILNANGSFSVTTNGAGTWLIEGFSSFQTKAQLGGFGFASYITRIAGPGYNPDNYPQNYVNYTTLVKGTYSTIDGEYDCGHSQISGTTVFFPNESYSLEYFYSQTPFNSINAGFLGPGHNGPFPDGQITDLKYHPFSALTLTKVSSRLSIT